MSHYLSIDTEATGLREPNYMIQLALVPVDTTQRKVHHNLGKEWLIKCPSFESLEPTLDAWNLEHNKDLIIQAHQKGVAPETLKQVVTEYLSSPEVSAIFHGKRPIILGKSLSALDIPMLKRYLGWETYEKCFHHHTLDVTCVARALVDSGKLPAGCESSSKLISHFGIRDNVMHTALSDAVDMAEIYIRLLDLMTPAK